MPRTQTEDITAYAQCVDPRCEGYKQDPVDAVRETVEHTYLDSGGDMPGVEKSQVYVRFADESDTACPTCDRARDISDQRRVVYQPLSGHAQDGLLAYKPPELPEVPV